jgi:hypothetical protein
VLIHLYFRCICWSFIHNHRLRVNKSLRDVTDLRYSSRDGHLEEEHVNRGVETPNFCPTLQVLDSSFLLCLSWLLAQPNSEIPERLINYPVQVV